MSSAGRTLTTDVTLPIVGVGFAATKMASDFQASMMQLVTQAGLPADQLKNLTAQVQAFAAQLAPDLPRQNFRTGELDELPWDSAVMDALARRHAESIHRPRRAPRQRPDRREPG